MVKTLHGTLDRNGAGCTVGEFVLASDYAALEARCAALLDDVNQDEGYERLKARCRELEGFLRRMLPPHIEQACDECGGDLDVCKTDHPDCPIREARGFLTASETVCEHEWGEYSIDNAKSPADPPKRYVWIKCIKCGEPQAATSNRSAKP